MFETLRLAQDDPNVPLKDLKIKPKGLEGIEEATPASETVLELYRRLKTHQHNIAETKRMVEEIRNQYEAERVKIERETGKVKEMEELQKVVNELSTLVGTANRKLVDLGTEIAYLRDEMITKPVKATDTWKLEKVLEKFDKGGEISAYLEAAVNGLQSSAKPVHEKELTLFPHPGRRPKPFMSSLLKKADVSGLLDILKAVYQDLKNYLTGVEEATNELQSFSEPLSVAASLSLRNNSVTAAKIVKRKGQYCVEAESGRNMGCYDTERKAEKRMNQIKWWARRSH